MLKCTGNMLMIPCILLNVFMVTNLFCQEKKSADRHNVIFGIIFRMRICDDGSIVTRVSATAIVVIVCS